MLRQCNAHLYFRGSYCPICGEEGKFLLNESEIEHIGRILSGILRHFPERYNIKLTEDGWAEIRDIVRAVQGKHKRYRWLRMHHIVGIIQTDEKGRYQIVEGKIRATYGHSINVTLDLPKDEIPDKLYYPSSPEEYPILLENGLRPSDRRKVHLSKTIEQAVEAGKVRVDNPVILEIDVKKAHEEGITIMKAGKTVYLADDIPARCIRRVELETESENEEKSEEQTSE